MSGLCECGCGQKTNIAKRSRTDKGLIKGQPVRYIRGHHSRDIHRPHTISKNFGDAYTVDKKTGCWNWNRGKHDRGYGYLVMGGKTVRAHRYIYEKEYGPIPGGQVIDHLCRNTSCVNPEHLEAVSQAENVRRGNRAKKTMRDAEEMRWLHKLGLSNKAIADIYETNLTSVGNILKNKIWRPA